MMITCLVGETDTHSFGGGCSVTEDEGDEKAEEVDEEDNEEKEEKEDEEVEENEDVGERIGEENGEHSECTVERGDAAGGCCCGCGCGCGCSILALEGEMGFLKTKPEDGGEDVGDVLPIGDVGDGTDVGDVAAIRIVAAVAPEAIAFKSRWENAAIGI